jgi:hypothetical protein
MTTEPIHALATEKPPPFQFRLTHLFVTLAAIGGALGILVPTFREIRRAEHQSASVMNLRQIAIALHNYHDTYRMFPPAYQVDATGKPVHSWRTAIMTFAESSSFLGDYRRDEPWNGPNNSRLLWFQDTRLFRSPASGDPPGMTNYVAIVGDGTMWPGSKASAISDITDGIAETIMVVEISNSDIHWMEPRDLPIEELEAWLDPDHKPRLFGNHIQGSVVAHADGSVEMLPRDVTIERLRAMITPAGND